MLCKLFIRMIRPSTGSEMSICQCFDPCDFQSLMDIHERLESELPEWRVLEVLV